MRTLCVAFLCIQYSAYALLRRYSTGILKEGWGASSVLGVGELIKFAISLFKIASAKEASEAPEGPLPDDGDSSEVSLSKELRHGDCIVLGKRSMLYVVSYGEYIEAWRKGELREIDVGRRPTWFSAMRAMYETGAQPAASDHSYTLDCDEPVYGPGERTLGWAGPLPERMGLCHPR